MHENRSLNSLNWPSYTGPEVPNLAFFKVHGVNKHLFILLNNEVFITGLHWYDGRSFGCVGPDCSFAVVNERGVSYHPSPLVNGYCPAMRVTGGKGEIGLVTFTEGLLKKETWLRQKNGALRGFALEMWRTRPFKTAPLHACPCQCPPLKGKLPQEHDTKAILEKVLFARKPELATI